MAGHGAWCLKAQRLTSKRRLLENRHFTTGISLAVLFLPKMILRCLYPSNFDLNRGIPEGAVSMKLALPCVFTKNIFALIVPVKISLKRGYFRGACE